jgi:glucosamine--fructose-6-phosphate aminotransferase (isomerizing)
MKDEIFSEPEVLLKTINNNINVVKAIAQDIKKKNITNIATVARGSSDNAAICFKYICEILCGIPVMEFHSSVTTMYKAEVKMKNNMMIAVSQSGKSIDTLAVLNNARKNGALTVSVTNDPNSPLAKASHYNLDLSCGEEKSVAATKTFAAELVVLYMLAIEISGKDLFPLIYSIPEKITNILSRYDEIKSLARKIANYQNTVILSRGTMQGVAKEMDLKFKECCYNMSHFYSVTDFMHGPLAIVDDKTSVLVLAPDGECTENYIDIVTRLKLLDAKITVLSDIKDVIDTADNYIIMPKCDNITAQLVYAAVCHILVMEIALEKGINPDQPRNLKKVTITK